MKSQGLFNLESSRTIQISESAPALQPGVISDNTDQRVCACSSTWSHLGQYRSASLRLLFNLESSRTIQISESAPALQPGVISNNTDQRVCACSSTWSHLGQYRSASLRLLFNLESSRTIQISESAPGFKSTERFENKLVILCCPKKICLKNVKE
ncbi:hypothetical protein BgiMline_035672 [Biomphalaria glabrata]|nr:hypothetical protein BgiMline_030971 [Biomphalaria glabrata]